MRKVSTYLGLLAFAAAPALAQQTFVFQDGVSPTAGYAGTADAHIIAWDDGDAGFGAAGGGQLFRHTNPEYPEELGTNAGPAEDPDNLRLEDPQNVGGYQFLQEGDNANGLNDNKAILIRFDLGTAIPASRSGEISNARIGLYLNGIEANNTNPPHTVYVNRILKPWDEGIGGHPDSGETNHDGLNTPDNTGAVTWNSTGRVLWQGIGATGPEDVAPPESETLLEPTIDTWYWFDVTESARLWVSSPSSNNGVKISQQAWPTSFLTPDLTLPDGTVVYAATPMANPTTFANSRFNFRSREHETLETHPQLIIELGGTPVPDWALY